MNKYQLKKLIKEVLSEIEGMSAGGTPEPDYTPEEAKEATVKLTLKGEKVTPGNIKRILKQLAAAAAQANYQAIRAEMEQGGQRVGALSKVELDAAVPADAEDSEERQAHIAALQASGAPIKVPSAKPAGGQEEIPGKPGAPKDKAVRKTPKERVDALVAAIPTKFSDKKDAEDKAKIERLAGMSPEELDTRKNIQNIATLERMARIARGEQGKQWADWEAGESEDRRKKEKLKAAQIKAGTFDPEDATLWVDRQRTAWGTEKEAGKSDDEAMRAAILISDPSNKEYWSNQQWSIYNDEMRRNRKPEPEAAQIAMEADPYSKAGLEDRKDYRPDYTAKAKTKTNVAGGTGAGKLSYGQVSTNV